MKRLLTVLLLLPVLHACDWAAPPDPEILQIKDAIHRYTTLLAQGYRRRNMAALEGAATEAEVVRVYHHMAALGEGGVTLMAELQRITFGAVVVGPGNQATAEAMETWDYRYSGQPSANGPKNNRTTYTLRYRLTKANQRWLVAGVDLLQTKEAPGNVRPWFYQRPADQPPGSPATEAL